MARVIRHKDKNIYIFNCRELQITQLENGTKENLVKSLHDYRELKSKNGMIALFNTHEKNIKIAVIFPDVCNLTTEKKVQNILLLTQAKVYLRG